MYLRPLPSDNACDVKLFPDTFTFIISPSTRKDGWIIRPLARSFLLPKTWIDKSRPDGCLYIDINRSFARFNSKEHAIDAATEFVNMVTNIYSIFQK